ncbi:MAG: hypothetical protein N4A40_06870 [Tissierellales bacterium]|jgi:hypothetical protein|nr:hypothetical protein [Tissierellales bacterium]
MVYSKKNIFFCFFISISMILMTGCENEVKSDFKHFLNVDLLKISEFESDAINEFNQITLQEEDTDAYYQKMYSLLSTSTLPTYETFVKELSDIKPETNDVRQLHQIYLRGAQKQLEAFKLFKQGIEEKNEYKITEANQLLAEAKTYMNTYLTEAVKLADELDLKWR